MSRPTIFSTLRSALPRRGPQRSFFDGAGPSSGPRTGAGPSRGAFGAGSGSGSGFRFRFGQQWRSSSHSSTVTSGSMRSSLFRPITFVLAFAPILTGYLGFWQVERLKWKVALIEEVDRNLEKEPMALPGTINLSALPEFAFRRVLIRGHFVGPPILQGPQTRDGTAGYHLILPFDRSASGGSTILVNRGFIKTAEGDAIRKGKKPVPGLGPGGSPGPEIVVEGMITKMDKANMKSYFTPDNRPETNEWFWKDIDTIAEHVGGEERGVQPVLIDAIERGEEPPVILMQRGEPVGRAPSIELRNQHLTYAITWFSLCAATSVMLGLVIAKGRTKKLSPRRAFGERR